jgi:DNA-binding NtrC family response regulator
MSDAAPIRLLIADDEQEMRDLCSSIGRRMGMECILAETAEEALRIVESDWPDIVLSDLLIGKMSGLELLAEIKNRRVSTEVALMSAYGSIETAVEAMRAGAFDFVVKPFRVEKLMLILERMADKARCARCEQHPVASTVEMLAQIPCTDLEELERLTVQRVFEQVHGDKLQARKLLGISRATLYRKMKRYGIKTRQGSQNVPVREVRTSRDRVVLLSQS